MLNTKIVDSGQLTMRCLESIHLGILPAPPSFELSFPGFSVRPVESGKVQKFGTGKKFRDLASEADYIICRRRGSHYGECIET